MMRIPGDLWVAGENVYAFKNMNDDVKNFRKRQDPTNKVPKGAIMLILAYYPDFGAMCVINSEHKLVPYHEFSKCDLLCKPYLK